MKQRYVLFLICVVLILRTSLVAQTEQQKTDEFLPRWKTPYEIAPSPNPDQKSWNPNITKRPGHYTKKDWRNLIDSVWGPGISTTEKLKIFDDYWTMVDQTWGSFPNLVINWDSLKNVYRPEVAAGVSRGRFYGILSRLTRALNEWHVWTIDLGIDSTFGAYSSFADHPNYPSYKYQPGIPIFNTNPTYFFRTNFGAGVTPLPDSTALVYSIMPNHPLNLQPGDIILGYDRVPWKYLIKEILDAELPILFGGTGLASSPYAAFHVAMLSVGMNWGLYDTIDVYKFSIKDTVHFPTSLLKTIAQPYHIATEQLPVKGVPFPDLDAKKLVSWGVVEGTTIGYIYVLDWWGVPFGQTKVLFAQAVDELLHKNNVSGLVIDFRTNFGGVVDFANDGFKQLFNFDPTNNFSRAIRIAGSDHNAFTFSPPEAFLNFTPGPAIFDRPIAVLTGPQGGSAGDYNPYRMRFHPMIRFFGKRTNGAYTNSSVVNEGIWYNSYSYRIDNGSVYSNYNNEGFMTHKSFPVDEEIWLTQAGVAKGEDGVVTRALEWITTLTHAHSAALDRSFYRPGLDSVFFKATLANPLNHASATSAIIADINGSVRDSILLYNDGLHGDGSAGDSVWGCGILAPSDENMFTISMRTDDITNGTYRQLPKVRRFTTAGPIVCLGETSAVDPQWGQIVGFRFKIRHDGKSSSVSAVTGKIRSLDTSAVITAGNLMSIGDFSAGQERLSSNVAITFSSFGTGLRKVPFEISFLTSSVEYWRDTVLISVDNPTNVAENETVHLSFSLAQNYPNPFNPTTTIRYSLPSSAKVKLTVYDLLGREIATLVNEEQSAGWKEVQWNARLRSANFGGQATHVSSGIYFYKLQAENFVETRKMIVVK